MPRRDITPDQVRETFKRHRLKLPQLARVDECKRLVAGWHNRFGACQVLDNDRLRALCRRLVDDAFSYDELAWAIEAYHEFCQADQWHREHPDARKTLASFMNDERLEQWIHKGEQLASQRAAGKQKATERRRANRLQEAWNAKSPAEQRELIQRAEQELGMRLKSRRRIIERATVQRKVSQLLQRELEKEQGAPTAVGEMV